jgi:cell division protein FtsZ
MAPKPQVKKTTSNNDGVYKVHIKVFGVGGGGGNAITRMHQSQEFKGIEFVAINTDSQDLEKSSVRKKIHIGKNLTRGLGTGMNPELGKQAAEENRAEIVEAAKGADLVFITAGLGGGTGSGASPIVAEIARESGALTIAIVTRPFTFEGGQRSKVAEEAMTKLKEKVDALIVVPNDRIFHVIKKDTPILKAFERIDEILRDAISGITELIASIGIINVDFADVKAIMKDAGSALVGVGVASGLNRASSGVSQALNSPLLEFSIEGARGVLFGVSGGRDLKMTEINEIAKQITANVDPGAKIIFGAYQDRKLRKGAIKVTLIATGFNTNQTMRSSSELPSMSGLFTNKQNEPVEQPQAAPLPLKERFALERAAEKKPLPTLREEKNQKSMDVTKKKSDAWEIPAFLRKKKQ